MIDYSLYFCILFGVRRNRRRIGDKKAKGLNQWILHQGFSALRILRLNQAHIKTFMTRRLQQENWPIESGG